MTTKYKIILLLIFVMLIGELLQNYFAIFYQNNSPIIHFLIPIQSILYGLIYSWNNNNKKAIQLVFSIITIISVLNTAFFQELIALPSYSIILLSFGLILISLLDFKRMLLVPTNIKLHFTPDFWFNLGTLLFYSLSFFIFGFLNLGLNMNNDWQLTLILILNVIMYSSYGLSLYLDSRKISTHDS